MINFINTGADEATLKSMSTDGCSEELIKAMNKQGLVQKDVTVQGKNGKTFTRKQWVKVDDSDISTSSQKSVSENTAENRRNLKKKIEEYTKSHPNPTDADRKTVADMRSKLDKWTKEAYDPAKQQMRQDSNSAAAKKKDSSTKKLQPLSPDAKKKMDKLVHGLSHAPKQSSSTDKLVSKISGTPKFGQVKYTNSGFEFTDSNGSIVSGETIEPDKVKVGDVVLLYNGMNITAVGEVKNLENVRVNTHSIHASDDISITVVGIDGKDYQGFAGSSVAKVTSVKAQQTSKKPSLVDIQGYGYDSATATGDPTYLKIGDRGYYKIGNNLWQYNSPQNSALGGVYTDSQISSMIARTPAKDIKVMPSAKKNGKSTQPIDSGKKTLDPAHFDSIKSDKAAALKYLKDCGITWTENSHAGINWMRAMAAYKVATGNQNSTQTAAKTSAQPNSQSTPQTAQSAQNSQPSGSKMSKEDAKKKTQSYTSKVGKSEAERKVFMDKVKAQGITWKDKADDGSDVAPAVNWMRCCMAMNKHFAEGGSFDDSDKSGGTPVAAVSGGKLGTKQDRETFLRGMTKSSIDDEMTKTLKKLADGFDPNIDSGSWIQPDYVLNINLDSTPLKSQQYDLGVKDGNAFKKLISDKLKEMGFEVNRMGKKKSADGVSFWFDLSSGNDDSKQSK